MDRMDYFDILPKGMDAYLSHHSHHFSKPMLEWAVGMMRGRNGEKIDPVAKKRLDETLDKYGVVLERNEGYYDGVYVWCMATADYMGSSITDEKHLAMFVKDFIDDPDNDSGTKAFDHFYIDCVANGIDIPWEDLI